MNDEDIAMINQPLPIRKQIRVPFWPYNAAGSYFITVCSYERECTFGSIDENFAVHLTPLGELITSHLHQLNKTFPEVLLEHFVVMPNHIHAIIEIIDDHPGNASLGTIVKDLKVKVSFGAKRLRITKKPVWQRGFYEHIIKSDKSMYSLREYIATNPIQWALDENNPDWW